MTIVYKTKANGLIKLLFVVALLIILTIAFSEKSGALLLVALGFCAVVLYIFYTTHYTISENKLTIKSGFLFSESINIESIKKITGKQKNLLSGPGFSSNRLVIEYNKQDCVIISPSQQQAFIAHLKKINPDIAFLIEK